MKFSTFARGSSDSPFQSTRYEPGDWNAIDDVSGLQYKASEMSRQWDGLRTADPEERHPQDFLRVRPDRIRVPWARPDTVGEYGTVVDPSPSDIRSNGEG